MKKPGHEDSPDGVIADTANDNAAAPRRDDVRHFAGSYMHQLRKTTEGYRIKLQRVDMTNSQAAFDYVVEYVQSRQQFGKPLEIDIMA